MRILALDHGTVRIGVALSDEMKMFAQPLEYIPAEPFTDVVTRVKTLVAGGVNFGLALAMGDRLPATAPLAGALMTGFLGYGVSIVLHLLALRQIGAARQAAYLATAPFIGALAAVPILGEPLTWKEVGAGVVMAAGLILLVRARNALDVSRAPQAS